MFYFMLRNESGPRARRPRDPPRSGRSAAGDGERRASELRAGRPLRAGRSARPQRGLHRGSYPAAVRLVWAWTYVHASLTAFVAPRPGGQRPLPATAAQRGHALRGETRGEEEFAGLRPITPGVPLKHMAWKTLARGGEPAVRSYTDSAPSPDGSSGPRSRDSRVKPGSLSCAAGCSPCESGSTRPYGLKVPGVDISPGRGAAHRSRCLRALAAHREQVPREVRTRRSGRRRVLTVALDVRLRRPGARGLRDRAAVVAVDGHRREHREPSLLGRARLCGTRPRAESQYCGGRDPDPVLAIANLQRAVCRNGASVSRRGTEDSRDAIAARSLRRGPIIYFLCLAGLLRSESFWLFPYLVGVAWLTAAALLSLAPPRHHWGHSMRYAARIRPRRCRSPRCCRCSFRASTRPCGTCLRGAAAPARIERYHEPRRHR